MTKSLSLLRGFVIGVTVATAVSLLAQAPPFTITPAFGTVGQAVVFTPDNTLDIGAAAANRPRTLYLGTSFQIGAGVAMNTTSFFFSNLLMATTSPTISSGFGTSPAIVTPNGTATFRVNVGTGGVATTGVVGLPSATNGWNCQVVDTITNIVTRQTANTTNTVTVTAASAWTASDILIYHCDGF